MVYNQISLAASLNKNIETDFLGNLNINGAGAFWEKVFYVYLYKRASTAYPDEAKRRYSVEDYNKIIYEAALLLCRCEMKLRKVLKHNR